MHHRQSISTRALASLIVALTLLSHDVVMAADPHAPVTHDVEARHHASHGGFEPQIAVAHAEAGSPRCGTFEAVRADRLSRDPDLAFTGASASLLVTPDTHAPSRAITVAPGLSPSQRRAQLQVWRI